MKTSTYLRYLAPLFAAAAALLGSPPARAAGLLVAEGGFGGVLEVQQHDVKVTISNGIAVTNVTQVFRNTEKRQVEALYTFPVPKGASVSNFSMWINGKEMVGEVLEKKRAREIYDSYKRVNRDPGLLEQVDFRTFEMRIFPIAAGAEQKVQLTYYQELEVDHDWATYVYPLATTARGPADARTTSRFSLNADVQSAIPISELESTSHGGEFVVTQPSETYRQASMELQAGSLTHDVVLAYHLARPQTGIDLLTSARPGEDGFFSVTRTAGANEPGKDSGADYVFVLDVSGSMADDRKLLLSKDCIGAFLAELSEQDRFELMSFNIAPHPAFGSKRVADAQAKHDALSFLNQAAAAGGTVLNPAITTAYRYADPDRPLNVVILSDGLTDAGESRSLFQLIQSRPRNTKVFCIGVGNDVNRPLLEQIAADSGGLSSFISRGDNFTRQARAFRRKLMNPVASDLEMSIGGAGVEVYDLEPKQLPNLYQGAPVRVYGRYRGHGSVQFALRGQRNGVEWKENATLDLPAQDASSPEIERMWAWHRIDALLKSADRTGSREQAIPEVIRLGEDFSIVTEYTSFLVLENDAELQRWRIERRNAARLTRDRQAQTAREVKLAALREKAIASLGPEPAPQTSAAPTPRASQPPPTTPNAAPPINPAPAPQRQSRDFFGGGGGGGGGAVGPLFVAASAWLARRRKQQGNR